MNSLENCPHCGAPRNLPFGFSCGSHVFSATDPARSPSCYERELTQKSADILGLIERVNKLTAQVDTYYNAYGWLIRTVTILSGEEGSAYLDKAPAWAFQRMKELEHLRAELAKVQPAEQ